MKHPLLVLSHPRLNDGIIENALNQAKHWKESLQRIEADIVLELPIRRNKREGWISDNPPIDRIDEILNHVEKIDCRFGSVHLPIDLRISDDKIGAEISAIDGWADLASYAEISLARFSLLNVTKLNSPNAQKLLFNTINYMAEMEINVAMSVCNDERSLMMEFMEKATNNIDRRCGLDLRLNANIDDTESPNALATTLSIPLPEPFSPEIVESLYNKAVSNFGDTIEAVVFIIE